MADDYLKTLDARSMLQAISAYMDAERRYYECADRVEVSADYYCAEEADQMERAAKRFVEHLTDLLAKLQGEK